MSLWQWLVLALVQGLTEFLPISSSAHLILVSEWFGWPDQGLAFDTAVHLGTLGAIVLYFRRDLATAVKAAVGSTPQAYGAQRLVWYLALASLPTLLAGYFGAAWFEENLRRDEVIAWATLVFAPLLFAADRYGRQRDSLAGAGWHAVWPVGIAQMLALIPGVSRSGITLTAALACGLTRLEAARFSFLLAVPVLAAAGGHGLWRIATGAVPAIGLPPALAAAGVAGLAAFATVHFFLKLIERVGLVPFVVYRLLLGLALLAVG